MPKRPSQVIRPVRLIVYNSHTSLRCMEEDRNPGKNRRLCAHCQRQIQLGEDVLALEQGVIGPRGLVPLEKSLWFCDGECAARYFGEEEVVQLPRRIP